jgi:hypothetical protein
MRFLTVQVLNYKSFRDSGEITLARGFNVIVGKNDAGKSALLEAISLNKPNKPHRSLVTAPTPQSVLAPDSVIKISVETKPEELSEIFSVQNKLLIPWNSQGNGSESYARFEAALQVPSNFFGECVNGQWKYGWLEAFGHIENGDRWIIIANEGFPTRFNPKFIGVQGGDSEHPVYSQLGRGME